MSKVKCLSAALAAITIAAGVLFGILPRNWVELFFHVDPDGGSGLLELLFALALVAMGAGIVLYAARRRARAKTNAARAARRFFPVRR